MLPDRLDFLGEFDKFYKELVNAVKEDTVQERDFYILMRRECKRMDRERREESIK
ncbi:hypothetical protein ES705_43101 [subsurface metagenome]|jgi:hypothetical protein